MICENCARMEAELIEIRGLAAEVSGNWLGTVDKLEQAQAQAAVMRQALEAREDFDLVHDRHALRDWLNKWKRSGKEALSGDAGKELLTEHRALQVALKGMLAKLERMEKALEAIAAGGQDAIGCMEIARGTLGPRGGKL